MEIGRMTWMQTVNGTPFELMRPRANDVEFTEIAHALSQICRFAGHTKRFYSVAEHCCRVADILPRPIRIHGLLHDAHEAYIGDVTTPVKMCLGESVMLDFVANVEDPLMRAIYEAANLTWQPARSIQDAVKFADQVLLMTERRDLMSPTRKSWGKYEQIVPLAEHIAPWNSERAAFEFLARFAMFTA